MNGLSLFSGIGGLDLGLERAGITTVGQVEIDPWCRRVLAKHWPDVPRHDDVRTAADWWLSQERPHVDLVFGGFPCQDISQSGRRAGLAGERSGLWYAMADTIRVLRPRWVLLENVADLIVRGLGGVLASLAEIGHDAEWDCIPAEAVGAPHRRDRWFGVAYTDCAAWPSSQRAEPRAWGTATSGWAQGPRGRGSGLRQMADADGERLEGRRLPERPRSRAAHADRSGSRVFRLRPKDCGFWAIEPDVGRVAHGVPRRVDRLRGLGNAVVPQVAEHVGRLIVAADRTQEGDRP